MRTPPPPLRRPSDPRDSRDSRNARRSRASAHAHAHPFELRHALLLSILFGVAVLVRADVAMPVTTRVPGFLVLAVVMLWLLLGSISRR